MKKLMLRPRKSKRNMYVSKKRTRRARPKAKPVNIRKAFKGTRGTTKGSGKVMKAVGRMLLKPMKIKVSSGKRVKIGRFAK